LLWKVSWDGSCLMPGNVDRDTASEL
jgi:hypothetical protein